MNEKDDNFLYGTADTEEEPLDKSSSTDRLEEIKLQAEEQEKQRKDRRYFSAFRLIVGCLVFLGIIYIVETIISAVLKNDVS